jgi:PASTA domain
LANGHVDILCYYGNTFSTVVTGVGVDANGYFSVNAPLGQVSAVNDVMAPCRLAAVPTTSTPEPPTGYTGPRVLVGENERRRVSGGPNNGKLYDFYSFFQQLHGGYDYDSLAECGVDDGYLSNTSFARTTTTWYCNAALFSQEADPGTRSELQIDGVDAWPTEAAEHINQSAAGLQKLTYTYHVDPKTGNTVIHDNEPFVKCSNHTYPPTTVTCASFHSAGVTDYRTITQDDDGNVVWVTDVFKSTDGKSHKLDLLWDNDERFYRSTGDSTQLEYKFPGQSGYSMHVLGDTVSLPRSGGTMFVRTHGAADGDQATGQGALVYDRPASSAFFRYVESDWEAFTLHQKATIPKHGSTRFRFAYVQGYKAADVAALAKQATTVFKGCTVPNVVGKSLAVAKRAIKKAHCAVGKITHVQSTTIPASRVVFEQPSAKTHVDYGTKVRLGVSVG